MLSFKLPVIKLHKDRTVAAKDEIEVMYAVALFYLALFLGPVLTG